MECPDKTWVAGFVRGDVPASDVDPFEVHLDACARCLDAVAETARALVASDAGDTLPDSERDSLWIHLVAAMARASERSVPAQTGHAPRRERIGRNRVVGEIGRGAMGVVYAVVDEATGTKVALKTVIEPTASSLAGIRHEIAFLRRVQRPGIVRLLDDGVQDGAPWYTMELLEGATLASLNRAIWHDGPPSSRRSGASGVGGPRTLAAGGQLERVLALYARICEPLASVHAVGAVHCDLKPSNVFVRDDGEPVLFDFGLFSRAGGAIGRETLEVGGLRGTLPYLAPESIRGQIPDARADLYALGCMLYETMTGRPPFKGATVPALLQAHLYTPPVAPSQLVDGLPPGADALIARLLAKDPNERVGRADLVADAIFSLSASPSRPPETPRVPYLFRPRMVGREEIVRAIDALADSAQRGEGRLALIGGESGIGKTFLASEVARSLVRRGFEAITGECAAFDLAPDSGPPLPGAALEPFRGLLHRAVDACQTGEDAAELFGPPPAIRVLAQYEPALERFCDAEEPGRLPPQAARDRVLEAMRALITRFATRAPLLIVLDDLQWADDLSLAVVSDLAEMLPEMGPVLVIALYRTEEASDAIAKLRGAPRVVSRVLTRLDDHALTLMAGDMLARALPGDVMRALVARAEGNPFFIAEYLRSVASDGLLVHTAGGWRLAEPAAASSVLEGLALPHSLHELLERRLVLLSAGARAALEAGALLGREFRPSLLRAVCAVPAAELEPWIDEMLDRQLAVATEDGQIRFAHDKIRELAYARIPAVRRRSLHLAAGAVLDGERARSPDPGHYDAQIGYHLRSGGEAGRSVEYFERAAEHALRQSANGDAVRLFREAEAACAEAGAVASAERRANWARRIGDALQGLGDLSGSKQSLLEALRLLGHPMPAAPAALSAGVLSQIAKQFGRRALRAPAARRGAPRDRGLVEIARAYDRLTQIYYYLGEYGPLFFANLATLDFAERAEPSPTRAVGFANVAATAGIIPLPAVARLYFELAEAALREAPDPEAESYYHVLRGHYLSGLGDWKGAAEAADRIMTLADELGFRRRWEEGAGLRSSIELGRNFDHCLAWCDRMFESAARRSDLQTSCWGHLRRAEVQASRGDVDGAEEHLRRAEALVPRLGLPEQIRALALRAHVFFARGRTEDSLQAADCAAACIDQTKAIHLYCVDSYARLARVRLAAESAGKSPGSPDPQAAGSPARRACQTLEKRRACSRWPSPRIASSRVRGAGMQGRRTARSRSGSVAGPAPPPSIFHSKRHASRWRSSAEERSPRSRTGIVRSGDSPPSG